MNTILVAAMIAIVGPLLLAYLTGRQRHAEKVEDYARQDAVAAKAEEAARLLLAQNKRVAKSSESTRAQLKEIHTLVNSNMTAAMQAQLVALKGQLVLMHRLAEAKKGAPTEDELGAIRGVEGQIQELETTLTERLDATDKATTEKEEDAA